MNQPPPPVSAPAPSSAVDPMKIKVSKELVHEAPLVCCRFDTKGRYVFAGTQDRLVARWHLETGAKTVFYGHESWVQCLAVSPDGETLISGGCDGVLAWRPVEGNKAEPARVVQAHKPWVRSISFSPDGALVATCGTDKLVKLWSSADGTLLREFPGHTKDVYRVLFHPSGHLLVSGDLMGEVRHWEIATGRELRKLDATKLWHYDGGQQVDYGGTRDIAFNADATLLACVGLIEASNPLGAVSNPAIVLFDWLTGKEKLLQRPKDNLLGVAWGAKFHPSGFLVVAVGGNAGGHLFFLKPDQVNDFHKFSLPNTALDLDIHPDGLRIATAHHDGRLRISSMG